MSAISVAALFVGAGGFVHLREWLSFYRHVPVESPGSAVVRLGFPVHVAVSAVAVAALVVVILRPRYRSAVVVGALVFELGAVGSLLASRYAQMAGWSEPVWTPGTAQSLVAGVGAILSLVAAAAISRARFERPSRAAWSRG